MKEEILETREKNIVLLKKYLLGGYLYKVMDNHFPIYVGLVIMMYALNLYRAVCQAYLSKTEREKKKSLVKNSRIELLGLNTKLVRLEYSLPPFSDLSLFHW